MGSFVPYWTLAWNREIEFNVGTNNTFTEIKTEFAKIFRYIYIKNAWNNHGDKITLNT